MKNKRKEKEVEMASKLKIIELILAPVVAILGILGYFFGGWDLTQLLLAILISVTAVSHS